MLRLIFQYVLFAREMGLAYTTFRACYEICRMTGIMKLRFPTTSRACRYVSLEGWRKSQPRFFFSSREVLRSAVRRQDAPPIPFPAIPAAGSWLTNPANGFRYAPVHWTRIKSLSREAGDIKAVWEMSRFTFLYPLLRRDLHYDEDHCRIVFGTIDSWITDNPVNRGPNWRCSQEIAIRVLNWTFALYYYKEHPLLTEALLNRILESIRRQMLHVAANRRFAQVAVRNNHILTESLALYSIGLLFPFFPESTQWKAIGRRTFEKEIAFQVTDEGSYIQHSMNYHRMVVQLLSWAIGLARRNAEKWARGVYDKAAKSVLFLRSFQDIATGALPNYGNNDGTLLFPLSSCDFGDYRPQLGALAALLGLNSPYTGGAWREETGWFTGFHTVPSPPAAFPVVRNYPVSGYYALQEADSLTFLRCARYTNRPFQSDNLHLDLWFEGNNLLRDAGTYGYNTAPEYRGFFLGSEGHNTACPGFHDQMLKGPRFIWLYRTGNAGGLWIEKEHEWLFRGFFTGYYHLLRGGITHHREVCKKKGRPEWFVTDTFTAPGRGPFPGQPLRQYPMRQLWHPSAHFFSEFSIEVRNSGGMLIRPQVQDGWYSERYGAKVPAPYLTFTTDEATLQARIFRKN